MHIFKTCCLALLLVSMAASANTTFTYQGQLASGGEPFDGNVDMEFRLFDAGQGGSQIGVTIGGQVEVAGGLFQVELDFGNQSWENGVWLEINVDGTTITPRQRIMAAPLAMRALEGGTPWNVQPSGISFLGERVAIGQAASAAPQRLSVRSGTGQDPMSVLTAAGLRALHVHENTGVTIGGFFLAPEGGLMVHGDAAQERTSYGFAKAGAVIECGDQGGGAPGSIVRGFNNVPSANPAGALNYLTAFDSVGNCRIELGFDLNDSIIVAMGSSFSGRNVECGVTQTTQLRCRVRNLNGAEFSARINVMVF